MKWFILSLSVTLLAACQPTSSDGTSTGNPVRINFTSYNPAFVSGKVSGAGGASLLESISAQSLSDLRLCVKRLRFKLDGESTNPIRDSDEDNLDFDLGEVQVASGGTNLGDVSVPPGTYSRVEIDLDDDCAGTSLRVINTNGAYSTDDSISIEFRGTTVVSATGSSTVNLSLQPIIDALKSVSSDGQIKSAVEGAQGSASN